MLKKILAAKISVVIVVLSMLAITTINDKRVENNCIERQMKTYKEITDKVLGMDISNLSVITVSVNSYNPTKKQCDKSPLIAASGALVTPGILAVSQDMGKKYNIRIGDKVMLEGYGLFTVGDYMNKRYSNRVDIISFIPKWSDKFGTKLHVNLYYNKRK